jgi:phage terminase large subunit-like protein
MKIQADENLKKALDYANGVIAGKIIACKAIKQACRRFISDLKNQKYYYNADKVIEVVTFVECIEHYKGQFYGLPFVLEDWQHFIVVNVYGLYVRETELRKYRSAFIFIARKNGKSALIGALALYHLIVEDEKGMKAVIAANAKEQAKELLDSVKEFLISLDPNEESVYQYYNALRHDGNEVKIVASDPKRLDSLNLQLSILDEVHSYPDSRLYDVLKSSQGMRRQPLLIMITTAGIEVNSFCKKQYDYAKEVLAGTKKDEEFFIMIFENESADEIKDPKKWAKSNPNINAITTLKPFIESQLKKGQNNPVELPSVLVKNFNIWLTDFAIAEKTWFTDKEVSKIYHKEDLEKFRGCRAWVGVDLAENRDTTAAAYLIEKDGKFYYYIDVYLPDDCVASKIDKNFYIYLAKTGQLKVTKSVTTDRDVILNDIIEKGKILDIISISYDAYHAKEFAEAARQEGFFVQVFSQTEANYTRPMKAFEREILNGNMLFEEKKKELIKWQFRCTGVQKNKSNSNMKPTRIKESDRNDGIVAAIMAYAGYMFSPRII